MTKGCRHAVFLDDADFPVTILEILPEQALERVPRCVPGLDAWGLPEGTACAQEAETELIVLIADQLLVEQAEAFQHRSPPTAEIDGINGTFVFGPMESGPGDSEPTIGGGSNPALQIGASAGQPGAANLVGPGFHQGGH